MSRGNHTRGTSLILHSLPLSLSLSAPFLQSLPLLSAPLPHSLSLPLSLRPSWLLYIGSLKLYLQQRNLTVDSLNFPRLTNVFTLQLNREVSLIEFLTFDLCNCLCRFDWMYGVKTSKSNGSTKLCSCPSRPFTLADSFSYMYTHTDIHYIHGAACAHIRTYEHVHTTPDTIVVADTIKTGHIIVLTYMCI